MKKTLIKWTISLALIFNGGFAWKESAQASSFDQVNQAYLDKVDPKYGYDLANYLAQFRTNEKLGYRPAGSDAEHQAGQFLAEEMKRIGLSQVTSDEFSVDSWDFDHAEMTFTDKEGKEIQAVLGAYQINFDTQGPKEFEIVYLNKGTASDYEGQDVNGKLVLVDINQMEEWWVTYPAYEAKLHRAAGVIVLQEAGMAEVSDEALNANDICGPTDAPVFSMSMRDGNALKEILVANNNSVKVTFDAKSEVTLGGKAYNISGRIEGKDKDAYILYSAHYDTYFDGFQDDSAAIGLMMGIAKAMVESGYQPEKTIIFNALAAEEWGVSDSRYDWSTGAYNQIFKIHPEWQGKAVANINFELPAMSHNPSDQIGAVYEFETFLNEFAKTAPAPKDLFPEGVKILTPNTTWADDWSFSIAGVPSIRNRFESDYLNTHYHTQFDNKETYNEAAYRQHHDLYGSLGIQLDRQAVVPIDLTTPIIKMKETINQEGFDLAGVDSKALMEEIDGILPVLEGLKQEVFAINKDYGLALEADDTAKAAEIYQASRALNDKVLKAYRMIQDKFVRLTWEDVQAYPHELVTNNLVNLQRAQAALENNEGQVALDEYLWQIDSNWYAYDFSKETYQHFTDYVVNQSEDRLMWGAGRIVSFVDLYDLVKSVQAKAEDSKADYQEDIKVLDQASQAQAQLLQELVNQEQEDLQALKTLVEE